MASERISQRAQLCLRKSVVSHLKSDRTAQQQLSCKTVDIFLHCDILLNGSVAAEGCFVVGSEQKYFHHYTHMSPLTWPEFYVEPASRNANHWNGHCAKWVGEGQNLLCFF